MEGVNNVLAAAAQTTALSPAEALAALLGTESLLLAVIGVIFNVLAAQGRRLPKLPVPPGVLAGLAVALLALVAAGATVAWAQAYVTGGWPSDLLTQLVALSIVTAVVAEPIFAFMIALGLRTEK